MIGCFSCSFDFILHPIIGSASFNVISFCNIAVTNQQMLIDWSHNYSFNAASLRFTSLWQRHDTVWWFFWFICRKIYWYMWHSGPCLNCSCGDLVCCNSGAFLPTQSINLFCCWYCILSLRSFLWVTVILHLILSGILFENDLSLSASQIMDNFVFPMSCAHISWEQVYGQYFTSTLTMCWFSNLLWH